MGDVLMTSPAIRALKDSVSGRYITLLTSSSAAGIAKHIYGVDDVIIFNPVYEKKSGGPYPQEVLKIIEQLKEVSYDAAVIFTVYSQSPLPAAMLCYMAGIPRVAGYCRENPYHLITDWLPDYEPIYQIKHEVQRQLDLVYALGASTQNDSMSVSLSGDAVLSAYSLLSNSGIEFSDTFILMHPGVSESRRQFPVSGFAEAGKALVKELGCKIVLSGVKSEIPLCDYIVNQIGSESISFAGKLKIDELIALIKIAPVLISNNTGPVHIAAAVGTPVVVVYALTNPQHTPWNVPHKVLPFEVPVDRRSKNVIIKYAHHCSFKSSPKAVRTEDIVNAVKELIKARSSSDKNELLTL